MIPVLRILKSSNQRQIKKRRVNPSLFPYRHSNEEIPSFSCYYNFNNKLANKDERSASLSICICSCAA